MVSDASGGSAFRVELLALPGFSMMALTAAIEPLRSANRVTGELRYRWRVVALDAGPVAASNGLELSAEEFDAHKPANLTIVVASLGIEDFHDPTLFHALRQRRIGSMSIGAVSNGSLLLARAGLLTERRATIHWEMQARLAEEFPETEVVDALFCIDREVMTAAGGAAAMDMMLALIAQRDGREIAGGVAEQFLHGPIRESDQAQRLDVRWRYNLTNPRLLKAIQIMEAHQTDPVRIARIAERAGLSERQLERSFETAFGTTPSNLYMTIRLKTARHALLHSTASIEEIAQRTGFSSAGHFSRAFKSWAGMTPSAVRRQGRLANVGIVQGKGGFTQGRASFRR